jgi:hypothetical protein
MFRWYKEAEVCYVYFADVQAHAGSNSTSLFAQLAGARWFTRGWTLQELLAPRRVVLYSSDWKFIGTRFGLPDLLSEITGIEETYLSRHAIMETASVSKRMSWAAKRETSRTEDLAYCLLGIFDVNMPLLYGGGKKAFRRLQEEIMKANPTDHTLFAWGRIVDRPMRQITSGSLLKAPDSPESIPWDASQAHTPFRGLFAESPNAFEGSCHFRPWPGVHHFYDPSIRSRQVFYPTMAGACALIELPMLASSELFAFHWPRLEVTQIRLLRFAILLCESEMGLGHLILIPLYAWGHDRFSRTNELMHLRWPPILSGLISLTQHLRVEPRRHAGPQHGDFLICRWGNTRLHEHSWQYHDPDIHPVFEEGIISIPQRQFPRALWTIYFRLTQDHRRHPLGFGIVFEHGAPDPNTHVSLSVALVPALLKKTKIEDSLESDGITWYHKSLFEHGPHQAFKLVREEMATPDDRWRLDMAPFPVVEVRVRKMPIWSQPEYDFSLVDITIF